jgi:hypothetical protein
MLLGEVGKLREERRALQQYAHLSFTVLESPADMVLSSEMGYLLCMKAKYGPGGEFEPDWYVAPIRCT